MDKFVIRGGNPLVGTICVSGAKNSALPCMAAAILTEDEVTLENIPQVRDIETERRLLASMGAEVELREGELKDRTTISCRTLSDPVARYEIVKTMRASSLVLGPLIARTGVARVAMPGGCAIGGRPIDLHIKGLEKMGAVITQEHGYLEARAERLRGAHLVFDKITVTGTEDLLMAAVLADGDTLMENSPVSRKSRTWLRCSLPWGRRFRARHGHDSRSRRHRPSRRALSHQPRPHRGGNLPHRWRHHRRRSHRRQLQHGSSGRVMAKLQEAGARVEVLGSDSVRVRAAELRAADISTEEYPGFPTDMQAQYMALATQAEGVSQVRENIFENRFMHVQELVRMGANIKVDGSTATVRGAARLTSAAVMCSDLRASASLVLAALVAEGETIVDRVYHMDRGYERFEEKLIGVGAQIQRLGNVFAPREPVAVAG